MCCQDSMARLPERLEAAVETRSLGGKARAPTVRTEPETTSALIGNQPRPQGARQTSGASFHRPNTTLDSVLDTKPVSLVPKAAR
jgi:hypothetical protein